MKYKEFTQSVEASSPPPDLSNLLESLWYDKKGDWDRAHRIAQSIETPAGSAVHAFLHREEGDLGNADYWYSRAGRKRPTDSLDFEWEVLAKEFL